MTRRLKKIFTVTLVLCLAFVVTGFFLCPHIAAKQAEEIAVIPTPPAPSPPTGGTVTVSVRLAGVIQINGDGTMRSNTHAVMQEGDHTATALCP